MTTIHFKTDELSVMIVHMGIMKKVMKKVLINQFGKSEGKTLYRQFKDVLEALNVALDETDGDQESVSVELLDEHKGLIKSFLSGYIQKLKEEARKGGLNTQNETLEILEGTLKKVS